MGPAGPFTRQSSQKLHLFSEFAVLPVCIVTEVANASAMCNAGDSEMTDLGLKVSSISILPKPKRSLATFLSSTTS